MGQPRAPLFGGRDRGAHLHRRNGPLRLDRLPPLARHPEAGWLDVTSDLDSERWQWGEVPDHYRRLWRELGGGPILSAAVKVQLDLDDIERNVEQVPDRCFELHFEELISRPRESLRAVTEFCGLRWDDRWDAEVSGLRFHDPTDKWKRHLSEEEGDRLLEFFARAGGGQGVDLSVQATAEDRRARA